MWPKAGQRAWQYASQLESGPCTVRGVTVEIDVADSGVLPSLGAASAGPIRVPVTIRGRIPTPSSPATRCLGSPPSCTPGGWQAIYQLNRGVIGANPDLITPGQVLNLP
ncbi:MAG: hypothetical protein ABSA53_05990 [Streptosporangiaceae bacterium]